VAICSIAQGEKVAIAVWVVLRWTALTSRKSFDAGRACDTLPDRCRVCLVEDNFRRLCSFFAQSEFSGFDMRRMRSNLFESNNVEDSVSSIGAANVNPAALPALCYRHF
jgi:hypothetical protein